MTCNIVVEIVAGAVWASRLEHNINKLIVLPICFNLGIDGFQSGTIEKIGLLQSAESLLVLPGSVYL